ncbi:hypothetical protein PI95_014530 [Hassallia byssoidea VB512170]|uniref:Uncharacterized protein n=1 Tax=Hassallia byssoidea VB512170 TaxID=1304833 RepID=A0A846H9I4_9CYAN|nr:hypothetical protein [Hassalia byssoidea]NEU73743.1 hypothetical protein [Hassalia byssoidea VB512170]
MGNGEWGIGHGAWASGIGHRASGMGKRFDLITYYLLPMPIALCPIRNRLASSDCRMQLMCPKMKIRNY